MMGLITIARPEDVDLAVPPLEQGKPSGMTLRQIADGYSKYVTRDWQRACNVEYRAGPSGPSVSLIAEAGRIWTVGDPRWPVMMATSAGAIIKEAPSEAEIKAARWAFSAGPWLVRGGKVANISAEIQRCGFSGLMEDAWRERAAIGIREDGSVVHYATMSAALIQVAYQMLALGCVDAINLDGGGSVGVLDSTGNLLLGYTSRQVCCALVFRRLLENVSGGETPMSRPRIYLSPSTQAHNVGVGDYGTEEYRMRQIAWKVGELLTRQGADVAIARVDFEPKDCVAESNAYRPIFHVALHSNSSPNQVGKGVEGFYWPGSTKGKSLTTDICSALAAMNPNGLRRVEPNSTLTEIAGPDAVCAYIEVGFHDRPEEAAWIVREMDAIAFAIAEVVCRHVGLPAPVRADNEASRKLEEIRRIVNS